MKLTQMTYSQAAQWMLDNCKLSGAAIDALERIVREGIADDHDTPPQNEPESHRSAVRELANLNGVRL